MNLFKNIFFCLSLCLFMGSCSQESENFSSNAEDNFFNGTSNPTLDNNNSSDSTFSDPVGGETPTYGEIIENDFIEVSEEAISTFSIDADGAAYANMRRYIQAQNELPPEGAIRTEELINYFDLDYEFNATEHPIDLNGEVSECPWATDHKLVRIGIQGEPIAENDYPASNFVFLIDVSGSMNGADRLELLKEGFQLFVDELTAEDRIAIVTYASNAGVLLESTSGAEKQKIKEAIQSLGAGGSTAGSAGITTAYEIAQNNFIDGGNNRIIVGTDGNFNVGISGHEELISFIEEKRDAGVFLTILGVGVGYNDYNLEQIANHGNGTFEYLDKIEQLKKVFIYEKNKFFTVAKDVKVQVEFNPENVIAYRLIGYENRLLETEDFEDDTKDAGEIGAGQNITALYEIIPKPNTNYKGVSTFSIDFRYKQPDSDTSIPLALDVYDIGHNFGESSGNMQFVSSVASFGMLLIDSEHKGETSYDTIMEWLNNSPISDQYGLKNEFAQIVNQAKGL